MKRNGIIKIGTKIENEDILIGKIKINYEKTTITNILNTLFGKSLVKDVSIKAPRGVSGRITNIRIKKQKLNYSITINIIEERKIQVGDKIAGRHGNKGIISKILPSEDMPYLPDGTPIDVILNPLGIPSRMNVGQLFESILTISAKYLKERYKILPFDEMQTKQELSKTITYNKLYEAKKQTKKEWLFNPNYPGKTRLIDGRTGLVFDQPISIGYTYMLKLVHLVTEKINSRLIGPYSLILKQPVRGKARNGGQRFGEMEVWAIEGFGAAYTLQELLTIKSDDLTNRSKTLFGIMKGTKLPEPGIPESFKTLVIELQSLCIELSILKK